MHWPRSAARSPEAAPLAASGVVPSENPFHSENPFVPLDREQEVERALAEYRSGGGAGRSFSSSTGQVLLEDVPLYAGPDAATSNPFLTPGSTGATSFLPASPAAIDPLTPGQRAAGSGASSPTNGGAWQSRLPLAPLASPAVVAALREGDRGGWHKGGTFGRLWTHRAGSPTAAAARERELDARDQGLQHREAALKQRESELVLREAAARAAAAASGSGSKASGAQCCCWHAALAPSRPQHPPYHLLTPNCWQPKNWPRIPLFPKLVHHDIAGEAPPQRQGLVRFGYASWIVVATGYLFNWLLVTIMFGTGEKKVSLWLFASIVAGAGLPLFFLCWYRSLYKGAISDAGGTWFAFFFHMAANIVWCWWMFVGVMPTIGGYSAGLFTMLQQFGRGGGKGVAFGVLSIANMALWAAGGLLSMAVLGRAYRAFRGRQPERAPAAPGARGGRQVAAAAV
eukprot:scaffold1.g5193.t1